MLGLPHTHKLSAMPNEQLVAHIRSELARGVDKTTLVQSLTAVGWKVGDINAAMVGMPSAGSPMSQSAPVPLKYAGFLLRAAAVLIDSLLLAAVNFPISIILGTGLNAFMLSMLIGWGYFVYMVGAYQATLGKMAVGLRIQRTEGEKMGYGRAALREIVGRFISFITLFIGYLMVIWTEKKQGLHDKIADTVVIEVDPTKSKTIWKVFGGIYVFLPILFIFGTVLALNLFGLGIIYTIRTNATDANIQSRISTVAMQAEIYFENSTTGYQGFCVSSEALTELSAASSAGTRGSTTSYVCNDNTESFAASVPLKSGGYVCVDSLGTSASEFFMESLSPGATACGVPTSVTQ